MNTLFKEISKSDWVHDSTANSCKDCNAHFSTTLRRHHCRYCGFIFCKKCLEKKAKISSTPLQKICKKCLARLKKQEEGLNFKLKQPSSLDFHTSGTLRSESQSSGESIFENGRIYTNSENTQQEVLEILKDLSEHDPIIDPIVSDYQWSRTKCLLESHHIHEEWCETIVKLVESSVKSVCNSVQFKGDIMDLNNYIKIQPIIHIDSSFTNFITGVAFYGKLASKKMINYFQSPKLLIIKKFSVFNQSTCLDSMDKLIDEESKFELLLLKKIQSLGPNLVICGNSMTNSIITGLASMKITAIPKVKVKTMKLLSRATSAKILKNSESLNYEKDFMGYCGCFYQETRGDRNLLHFTGLEERTCAGTIFISGPDFFELGTVKTIIRQLIVEYRNALFEKSLLKTFEIKNPETFFAEGNENSILIKNFAVSNSSLCTCPTDFGTEFYRKQDQTLGEFLINLSQKFQEACSICRSSIGSHSFYMMKKEGKVKVTMSEMKSLDFGQNIIFNRECKICGKFQKNKNQLTNCLWEYSFYKFINNFFSRSLLVSSSINCKHSFFTWSKFSFYLEGKKIMIEWEDNPCFKVLTMNDLPDKTLYFTQLTQNIATLTQSYSKKILQEVLQHCEELLVFLSHFGLEERKSREMLISDVNQELAAMVLKVSEEIAQIDEMDLKKFESVLEAETWKRQMFLKVCEFKKAVTSLHVLIKTLGKKDKVSVADAQVQEVFMEGKAWRASIDGELLKSKSFILPIFPENSYKNDEILTSKEFLELKHGNHTLLPGPNSLFIPVDEFDTSSIISHALNTSEYHEEVLSTLPSRSETYAIESELLNCSEKHFQVQFSTYASEDLTKNEDFFQLYGDFLTFNVHSFYPRQFHIIRDSVFPSHTHFLSSFYQTELKKEQLGKSKASFSKTHDSHLIIKVLEEKEFSMFKDLAPNYFRHFCNSEYHNMPSRLVRTLGCFRVFVKNHTQGRSRTEWVLLFENLGAVMSGDYEVYDLKGSFNERRYVQKHEKKTKMDKNFIEDFKGLPITISLENKKMLDMSVWNDTLFLCKKNVVDYSLLLMVSVKQRVVCFGIIDYITKYTLERAVERKIKKVVAIEDPTIARPVKYKNRFRESCATRFFVEAAL